MQQIHIFELLGLAESRHPLEATVLWLTEWLKLGIELVSVGIVAIGVGVALVKLARSFAAPGPAEFIAIRLILARYLALALEFQLGADILGTAIAPSWAQIGKLGAIAVIRTGLNFFLSKELQAEEQMRKSEKRVT